MNTKILDIDVAKIQQHKDNPRKDLGDLSELAESIKANGILQNLTVIENEIGYTVVIGHRRLAAAKLAGLKTVPCTISTMDYAQQIRTMLTENLQRADLTVYEQAQGFQMMLDLGDSVEQIAEKAGFSQATVRRRMQLLKLDREHLKKATERGATLMDFAELEKIEDVEKRNQVLKNFGTVNFKYSLQHALDEETHKKNHAWILGEVKKFATKATDEMSLSYVAYYGDHHNYAGEFKRPADDKKYFYIEDDYAIRLGVEKAQKDTQDETERRAKREEEERQMDLVIEMFDRAKELRREYITNLTNAEAKKKLDVLSGYAACAITSHAPGYVDYKTRENCKVFGIKTGLKDEAFAAALLENPEHSLAAALYLKLDNYTTCYMYPGIYRQNTGLDYVYDFLVALGYQMSDDEIAMRDGTHELYVRAEQ